MTSPAGPPLHNPVILHFAGQALAARMRHDDKAAVAAVQTIADLAAEEGLWLAICAWCDLLYAEHPEASAITEGRAVMGWVKPGVPGGLDGPADVSPVELWAGQMLFARMALDTDECVRLLNETTSDNIGQHIGALLAAVAGTLTSIQNGTLEVAYAMTPPPHRRDHPQ